LERTLVLIKPDGVQRGLIGEITSRLEKRGFLLVAAKFTHVSDALAREHYKMHQGKPFYEGLIKYITSSPVMAMVWEGPNVIQGVRQTMGATNPLEADPGTIRHDFAILTSRNLTHASDSEESSNIEINNWFSTEELFPWSRTNEIWFTGKN
jgi:nucleoside-diphosphate kinase